MAAAMHRSRHLAAIVCLGLFAIVAASATPRPPPPEPALRLTRTLTPPAGPQPVATDRALSRLEARAKQSRAEEASALADMNRRLDRMGRAMAELQTLIAALPDAPCPAAPALPSTTAAHCPTPAASVSPGLLDSLGGDLAWLGLAGGIVLLVLLAMLGQYRRRATADFGEEQASVWPQDTEAPQPSTTKPPDLEVFTHREAAEVSPSPASAATAPDDMSLQLADVMLSMRLTENAARTLEEHIRSQPRQALVHWLKLLDIYRRAGQQDDFEASALQLQRHFNVSPPDWHSPPASGLYIRPPSLESYPHISSRIQELWPRRSCSEYLDRLLADNRGGARGGFPQAVVEEILLLLSILRP